MSSGQIDLSPEDERVLHLVNSDENFRKVIDMVGNISVSYGDDYFTNLVDSIVGQQLSAKAARTIQMRLRTLCGTVTPESMQNVELEAIRQCGISHAKANYIKALSTAVLDGELNLSQLTTMDDEDVIKSLTNIKGIGRWTAEMFLIFSLGRLNVLSFGDMGLQKAIKWIYDKDSVSNAELAQYKQRWHPYNTIASLYLWELIDRGLVTSK
ncbi:MAG: hypothetical protein A2201_06375 [Alicyclobacillus sp. RIFOXYA1_FULL_53_8]|nr:MAG: hypothetical protein A2201_06375 [Alicyclobacillus sp. RIFOXYA1_FULL_53_8]